MIDLSHLTEEEQEKIMTVLRRDAELKKAEEERVRKLGEILSGGPRADGKLKYLTGEWFYEVKSLRHADKIHGSDIILASMKQGKAASLDGSLKMDRPRISSSRSSDIVAPQKPARSFEAQKTNEAEKENRDSSVCSPRLPRHNPFNRASLIVVEPPENNSDPSDSRQPESLETEVNCSLKGHPARESSQTSGGSATSDGSSVAFRPVPKKRTFLPRRTGNQTESPGPAVDAPAASPGVVPAPRRSLQQASSGSSEQSCPKSREEPGTPPKSPAPAPEVRPQPVPPSRPADERNLLPLHDATRVSSSSSPEAQTPTSSEKSDRPAVFSSNKNNQSGSTKRETQQKSEEQDDQSQGEQPALGLLGRPNFITHNKELSSRMENPASSEELSLPQSIVDQDPPISYDLHFIDKSDQPVQKPSQTHVFKLSTQATSPNGDEDDSIAKVLDWFSRSVDSSEWLNSDEGPEAMKIDEVSALREGEPGAKTAGKKKEGQIKRQTTEEDREFRGSGRNGSKEVMEGKVKPSVLNGNLSTEGENHLHENQPVKISNLKSFWEKSNTGPKILVSKVITPGDKGQKPALQSAEKESEILPAPRIHSERRTPDKISSSQSDQREQQQAISPHADMGNSFHLNDQKQVHSQVRQSPQRRNNDSTHTSDYLKLLPSPQAADRSPETEAPRVTKRSPTLKTTNSLEPGGVAAVGSSPPPDRTLETGEEMLKITLSPLQEDDLQTSSRGPDSEKLFWSKSSPYMDHKESVNVQITTKAHNYSDATEDRKGRDYEDRSLSPKAKEETLGKDRAHSPHSNRQESTAERIKQLKSFWEQERNRPIFYTGKPKPSEDGKVPRGANLVKLNKRFTKSEYDLRSLGNESDGDDKYDKKNAPNFTVAPLNQRLEKVSPTLSASRSQFNTLRDFWDEATSDAKGTPQHDNLKSPKRREATGARLHSAEPKGGEAEIYRLASAVEKTRPPIMKSSPSHQIRSKSPHDRQPGSGVDGKSNVYVSAEPGLQKPQTRKSLKDSNQKPQSSPRKDMRPPKGRKDSFSTSSSRGNSMRRATSMFALSAVDGVDQSQVKIDVSPVHSQSRKPRQNADKGSVSRRSSEEALTPPLARAFVPTDYRHYLGMTDMTGVHTPLAPTGEAKGSEGKSEYEVSVGGPVRASTPVISEERQCRPDSRAGQHPLWTAYSSSGTGMESSTSSTSGSWSSSRKMCEMDDEQSPVKKALWRAELRPKNLAKSMEDITGPLSPRQERRPDPACELRRISNVSSIPSSSSSLFSDSDHLKNMSKSVPSFLQNELSGSVTTMYSGDFGNVEVQGYIQFSINYIQKLKEFHIFVAECSDLAAVEPKRGRSDPYVKSYLVPDKANLGKRKSSVKKKTLNPTFNEILRYRVRMEYLRTQTLILSVWHHDTFGRNSFLGEVDVDLSKWDFDHARMNYLALKPRATPAPAPSNGQGEMKVAIRFLPQIVHSEGKEGPSSGEIHIWVKECKNLPLTRASIDPYVKCFVLPDTSRKSRQKTRVLRRTADPVFNHTMVYDGIRDVDLTEACVELTVWDRDRLASNLLGGVRLGAGTGRSYGAAVDWMDSSPFEVALWDRMVASPNEWVEDVLPLRVLHSAKTAFK